MRLSDFDYELPEELIAQEALADRSASRMLVVHKDEGRWEDRMFRDLPQYLRPGDCLVVNNSRVLPSRLFGTRGSGGRIEVLLLEPAGANSLEWKALVRPGKKVACGEVISFDDGLQAEVIGRGERGERTLRFSGTDDLYASLERLGHMPLPPYIKREDRPEDRERYQTVYAKEPGSVAAPTAGLHFTPEVLGRCTAAGAERAEVTLHVGLGTFQPLQFDEYAGQKLHPERYSVTRENWAKIQAAKRVIGIGTTSVRTMEAAAASGELSGSTNIFLYPGYQFLLTQAMLTNFHLPKTSLVLLVAALAGRDFTLAAYRHAVESKYRFFSYGDCMLVV